MRRRKVLVACGDEAKRQSLTEAMRFRAEVTPIGDGWLALHLIDTKSFSAIVVAEKLDSLNGLDVAYSVREGHKNSGASIMLLAEKVSPRIREMYETGIIDCCISDKVAPGTFLFQFSAMCAIKAEKSWDGLDPVSARVLRESREAYNDIFRARTTDEPVDAIQLQHTANCVVEMISKGKVTAVMQALQSHDDSNFVHSLSVAAVLAFYGQTVGVRNGDLNLMAQAGFAHDIGKRATPHAILYKPGPLNDGEMIIMRDHAKNAGSILRVSDGVSQEVVNVAERHHEKMDGTGYPNGMKMRELDELSMVASIGDVFSALTDRRCYKASYSSQDALDVVQTMSGNHLEPYHAQKFIEVVQDTGFTLG